MDDVNDGFDGFDGDTFSAIYRREVGRCLATLVRVLGDIDLAEDMVADAFALAAQRWSVTGIPPNPGGWITTTARNVAIDRLRRESTRVERHAAAYRLLQPDHESDLEPTMFSDIDDPDQVPDDQLRLMFLCCHPALAPDVQVAMTLRLLGGLETAEIARAFLVPEPTMAQRLVRAKRKIRDNNFAYRIPHSSELHDRLRPVLAVVYLIFNEGYSAASGTALMRVSLSDEAIRLGRLLVELLPDEAEPAGLLALMLLTDSRRPARVDSHGALVRLADQDRSCWNRDLIAEGQQIVRACIRRGNPGPYQIQAAIAAVHSDAPTAAATDWSQVVALYNQLYAFQPTDIVWMNRSIAVAELSGPQAGLDALATVQLDRYYLFHATHADLLARVGRLDAADDAYRRAIELSTNETERTFLEQRRAAVRPTK